jgi:hypothetical protein
MDSTLTYIEFVKALKSFNSKIKKLVQIYDKLNSLTSILKTNSRDAPNIRPVRKIRPF